MTQYLKQFAEMILESAKENQTVTATRPRKDEPLALDTMSGTKELVRELSRLDARDFDPVDRAEFMRVRSNIAHVAGLPNYTKPLIAQAIQPLAAILDRYNGQGSGGVLRQFPFIANKDLKGIVERDHAELVTKLYPSEAWKSVVVISGSILEAILFDRLADAKWNAKALASKEAPKNKGVLIPFDDWKLYKLIDVSVDIGLLPKDPADTIHQVLRDFRNFVHPKVEIRMAHPCTDAEGMLSLGALNSVCNYIEKNP